jgi:hypothetical protein
MNKKRESNQEDKWRIFKWESTSEKKNSNRERIVKGWQ